MAALKKKLGLGIRLKKPRLKLKKPKPKLRGREMKPSSMVMMSAWLRSRML